jgi:hypothetical protein
MNEFPPHGYKKWKKNPEADVVHSPSTLFVAPAKSSKPGISVVPSQMPRCPPASINPPA